MKSISKLYGVDIVAICDLFEDNVLRSSKVAEEIGNGEKHKNVAD